jgi:hypothetical protein
MRSAIRALTSEREADIKEMEQIYIEPIGNLDGVEVGKFRHHIESLYKTNSMRDIERTFRKKAGPKAKVIQTWFRCESPLAKI